MPIPRTCRITAELSENVRLLLRCCGDGDAIRPADSVEALSQGLARKGWGGGGGARQGPDTGRALGHGPEVTFGTRVGWGRCCVVIGPPVDHRRACGTALIRVCTAEQLLAWQWKSYGRFEAHRLRTPSSLAEVQPSLRPPSPVPRLLSPLRGCGRELLPLKCVRPVSVGHEVRVCRSRGGGGRGGAGLR